MLLHLPLPGHAAKTGLPDLISRETIRSLEVRKGNVKTAMSLSPKVTQIGIGASFEL